MLKPFAYLDLINLLQWEYSFIIFGAREVWMLLHSLQTVLFRQIAVMFACLMILFEDRSIKYEEAFSMRC